VIFRRATAFKQTTKSLSKVENNEAKTTDGKLITLVAVFSVRVGGENTNLGVLQLNEKNI